MKIRLNQRNVPIMATFGVFALIYLIGSLLYQNFFSLRVFCNLFYDNAFVGVIAVGMTFVIISGGIDLSVGSVIAFTGVFMAKLIMEYQVHPFFAMLFSLTIGALLGFMMGCIIHYFKLPAFLVTLVGMFLMRGLAFQVTLNSIPIRHNFVDSIVYFGIPLTKRVYFSGLALLFLLVVLGGVYVSHFTKFGRNVYAIGGNEQSAILMGLPIGKTKILIYTMNSTLAALAGIVYTMYTVSGYPLATVGLELDVIASVVIGGTLLTGGAGYVEGTLLGVLILGLIQTIITFQGTLSSWWTKIFIGILLSAFILLQTYISKTATTQKSGPA
ncbi:sugar ABC transporter permease YjfF [candidate division KSB3 bacterium]|uniref:Sugar ABC transporter permease YjfF n=1 Tax=candidate division KSB3 bacterium TaxID=2044937 RepID=A0A2G6K6C8_9BACT|nr:MAG: sugar ABC transporter permease YjfF [candidate division KSB3 bacterium]